MVYGNPEEIRRLATRVRTEADLTRAEAGRGGNADAVEWKSLAAQRYRTQLTGALDQARAAVGELEELSDALIRHAAAVQHRLDQIAAAERWLRNQAEQAAGEARDLAAKARGLAGDLVDGVTDVVSDGVDWVKRHTDVLEVDARRRADSLGREVQSLRGGDLGWLDAARTHGWSG
jgi:hypothetical protein